MPRILTTLFILACTLLSAASYAADTAASAPEPDKNSQAKQAINTLEKPLYSPFIERYVLDEIKSLRTEQAANKQELTEKILDREHKSVDRAVSYATDTITYFFYLIATATSVLVLVGWSSIRDIKDRVHSLADEEISKLTHEYEKRLGSLEKQLQQKTRHIEQNRDEIELTQEVQSLWLRAQQDSSHTNKISIYDEILKLRHDDCEALTYKADAVLELNEPQWAVNLCHQALKIDPENSHAFYQLACAHTAMEHFDEALNFLAEAVTRRDTYLDALREDPALEPLVNDEVFKELATLLNKPVTTPEKATS